MRVLSLFLAVPLIVSAQQRPAPAASCAADGYVVNALTGEPIPRATLQFGAAQMGTVSDSAGRWKISGILCGRVMVSASKVGFLNPGAGRLRTGIDSFVTTAPDSPAHDMRVELTPQSVITGKVVDEAGDPVQNVQVLAMTSRVLEGRRAFMESSGATTNDLGEFRVAGLASGKVIVCARPPLDPRVINLDPRAVNTDAAVLAETCYPGPVEGGSASAIALAPGRETRVDFNLSHVAAARIRGRVTGMPENSVVVVLLQSRRAARNGGQARPASMQRDGSFELRGVAAGSWMLAVDYWEAGARLFARVPVEVNGGDVDGVVVHLEPGFTATGTVRVESTSGRTLSPQQIMMSLRPVEITGGAGSVQWDKDHTAFMIRDVTPGVYSLVAGNFPAPFYLKSAVMGGRDLAREAVPIGAGSGQIDVVIADDSGTVQGRIEDANGDAATGWATILRDGRASVNVRTDADGSFKAAGFAPGDYRVFGWDDIDQAEWADAEWMRRFGGSGVSVTVNAGQSAEVRVARLAIPRE